MSAAAAAATVVWAFVFTGGPKEATARMVQPLTKETCQWLSEKVHEDLRRYYNGPNFGYCVPLAEVRK